MLRRDFLVKSLGGLTVSPSLLSGLPEPGQSLGLESITKIAHAPLRPEDDARLKHIPTRGALKGQRFRAGVPDTLDLAERLRLSLIALTNRWFPEHRWRSSFHLYPARPFTMCGDLVVGWMQMVPKFIECFVYSRLASGSDLNLEVDRKVIATQLGLIGEDGLSYFPQDEFLPEDPWDYSDVFAEGRWLATLAMLAQVDNDPRWEPLARRKIDRLLALSCQKEGFRYFWDRGAGRGKNYIGFRRGDTPPADCAEIPPWKCTHEYMLGACDPAYPIANCVIAAHGAAVWYRLTKYAPALELSRGMARWALARIFTRLDGRYFAEHFYHGTYALMTVGAYAEVAQDEAMFRHIDACYRWARDMGDPLTGWYPYLMPGGNGFDRNTPQRMEVCGVVNLMNLALYLCRNGLGDYWDDVDHWVRNRLAVSQVTDVKALEQIPTQYLPLAPAQLPVRLSDTRDVAARAVGGCFAGMSPNDGLPVSRGKAGEEELHGSLAACCLTNPSRALFYVWDSIVTGVENDVRVNLLLNRASEWVDVSSYLPVQGKVVLKIKKTRRVKVRMPEWADLKQVAVSVGDRRVDSRAEGRYLSVESLQPGDEVALTFPVPERTVNRVIARWPYKLTVRGADVVGIDPAGVAYPLYREQPQGKLVDRDWGCSWAYLLVAAVHPRGHRPGGSQLGQTIATRARWPGRWPHGRSATPKRNPLKAALAWFSPTPGVLSRESTEDAEGSMS